MINKSLFFAMYMKLYDSDSKTKSNYSCNNVMFARLENGPITRLDENDENVPLIPGYNFYANKANSAKGSINIIITKNENQSKLIDGVPQIVVEEKIIHNLTIQQGFLTIIPFKEHNLQVRLSIGDFEMTEDNALLPNGLETLRAILNEGEIAYYERTDNQQKK